ncbi:MAG: zinc-binding dehydrogenase [Pirellulales bacterium]
MPVSLPQQMRGVVMSDYHEELSDAIDGLAVRDLPVPTPGRGQVLVRVEAAPCNPSDLMLLLGKYGQLKTLPSVPGWEGAGTVVASGRGLMAGWLRGKRVACALQEDRNGTWAQYVVAGAMQCIPLKKDVSFEQGACLIVNPLTAMGLLETARRGGHAAAVHTAGASQLGRMMIAMAEQMNYPLVNLVRREEQVQLLRSLGATHVLNSSVEDIEEQLQETCQRLRATAAFEAVGGDLTGTVMNVLPRGSTVYVYGALSEEACGNIDPIGLIFHDKTVTGFYLGEWLQKRGSWGILRAAGRVQRMILDGVIETSFQRDASLDDVQEGLRQYVDHMTDGKLLIRPQAD